MNNFERVDDYDTIINYLFNNTGGYDNKYAIYRRNIVSDTFDVIDISSMSAYELIDTLARKALYKKVGGKWMI